VETFSKTRQAVSFLRGKPISRPGRTDCISQNNFIIKKHRSDIGRSEGKGYKTKVTSERNSGNYLTDTQVAEGAVGTVDTNAALAIVPVPADARHTATLTA